MTDMDDLLGGHQQPATPPGGRRAPKQRRRGPGCLIALLILAVVAGAGYWGVTKGIDRVQDAFASADDYPGPGGDPVIFEVKQGDTISDMGRGLKADDVVASVDAFISAANANPQSNKIQAGAYGLKKQMKASDVVAVLVNPDNIVTTHVTVPEGLQVSQVVDLLVEKTGFKKAEFEAALKDPKALGLPDYAEGNPEGNPEGYLFPATYDFRPDEKPADMLHDMVARWQQAAQDNDLEAGAETLGYTPHQIMTIASMIEAEGRGEYRAKIARVIYNRLEIDPNPAAGFLQIDATVNYALGRPGPAVLTQADIDSVADSPYNTYRQKGLPPGPIEAPGDDSIQAALHPADGPWFFYVTTNLKTGETKFTDSYDEFLEFKQELQEYCDTQSDRC
ncbi:MAG TPA: endolytic transglycosylase MltG [Nocardioides sp.]|uniref:endolytic transglycosylase MltG n=1 Tax=Nocardioides sp. TaxID=35761 RepID=UPI002E372650|nr:endolytic transglycosylase MltG [Nocardioides sp.]HEX5086676.1 endolytic transglycosylase MltG [Nocardioides sp.]